MLPPYLSYPVGLPQVASLLLCHRTFASRSMFVSGQWSGSWLDARALLYADAYYWKQASATGIEFAAQDRTCARCSA